MLPTPIVLIETDYETREDAIAAKDAQTAQLAAQGIPFTQTTLYRLTDGCRVFVITPDDMEPELTKGREAPKSPTQRNQVQKRRERLQQVNYR